MITAQELREVLSYDPETGVFTRIKTMPTGGRAGSIAGHRNDAGYIVIRLFGKQYKAHRLAFLYMTGEWPDHCLDHADGNPSNNSWGNLRQATHSQNMQNKRVSSLSEAGFKGVYFERDRSKWRAEITVSGRRIRIGRFNCPTAAHLAYCKAAKAHFGEFAREK